MKTVLDQCILAAHIYIYVCVCVCVYVPFGSLMTKVEGYGVMGGGGGGNCSW